MGGGQRITVKPRTIVFMKDINSQEIDRAIRWVKQKVSEIGYGEIGINLVIHQGEICKTEYRIIEKKTALGHSTKPTRIRINKKPVQFVGTPETPKDFKLITVGDVAKIFGLHPGSVRRLVASGKIPHIKIGRSVRFDRDELMKHYAVKSG